MGFVPRFELLRYSGFAVGRLSKSRFPIGGCRGKIRGNATRGIVAFVRRIMTPSSDPIGSVKLQFASFSCLILSAGKAGRFNRDARVFNGSDWEIRFGIFHQSVCVCVLDFE